MEKRQCGKSGIEVSVLGVGVWSFGGGDYWGPQDEGDAANVVDAALDCGVNFFDTAEVYNDGRSEETLGRILKGRRGRAVIGAKIPPEHAAPDALRRHCEASLRRLQTDYIDVYMVHWPIERHSTADAFATLAKLKAEGKIRAIGVSNFGVQQLGQALATGAQLDVNQLCYNLLSRAIELEIAPLCRERQIGVTAYMPLLQGILTDKFATPEDIPANRLRTRQFRGDRPLSRHGEPGAEEEVFAALGEIRRLARSLGMPTGQLALAWTIAKPGVTSVIAGARNAAQLRENALAAAELLPADVVARLDEITEPVLRKLGGNADYFQGAKGSRIR